MAKRTRTTIDLQNTTQKTKDPTTRTPIKTRGERRSSKQVSSFCFTSDNNFTRFLLRVIRRLSYKKRNCLPFTNLPGFNDPIPLRLFPFFLGSVLVIFFSVFYVVFFIASFYVLCPCVTVLSIPHCLFGFLYWFSTI